MSTKPQKLAALVHPLHRGSLGIAGSSQVIQNNADNPEEVGTALGSTIAKDAFTLLDADYAPCLNVCSSGV